jgi:predicted metalloprotease
MRLDETPESQNVDDLRGEDATGGSPFGGGFGGRAPGGGGLPLPIGGGGLGLVIVVVLALFFGLDPAALLGGGSGGGQYQPVPAPPQMRPMRPDSPGTRAGRDDEMRQFVARVLGSTEEVWDEQLPRQANRQYQRPRLVLFSGAVRSACGMADAAVGPFYCPGDQRVYIDLSFYDQLARRFGAPGDFAQAYVLGHEIGHHIQNQLGILAKVQEAKSRMSRTQANALQVRTELQADCFAGAWAFHANQKRRILEPGDVEEGLRAAAAIGDDRLQRQARGYVQPESFTHGTSAQRQRWFQRGLQSGELRACDTFNTQEL